MDVHDGTACLCVPLCRCVLGGVGATSMISHSRMPQAYHT